MVATKLTLAVDRTELEILELVSYVIEALAEECPREASHALADLLHSLDDSDLPDARYAAMVRSAVLAAQRPLSADSGWPRRAAVILSGLSRKLWERLLPKLSTQ